MAKVGGEIGHPSIPQAQCSRNTPTPLEQANFDFPSCNQACLSQRYRPPCGSFHHRQRWWQTANIFFKVDVDRKDYFRSTAPKWSNASQRGYPERTQAPKLQIKNLSWAQSSASAWCQTLKYQTSLKYLLPSRRRQKRAGARRPSFDKRRAEPGKDSTHPRTKRIRTGAGVNSRGRIYMYK